MNTNLRTLAASLLAVGLMVLAAASFARAADTIYWGDYGSGHLGFANLAGGGGGILDLTGASADEINGLAIDSAAGRIYWADSIPRQHPVRQSRWRWWGCVRTSPELRTSP